MPKREYYTRLLLVGAIWNWVTAARAGGFE